MKTDCEFSKREIVEAGKSLKGVITQQSEETLRAFKIAHNWRSSHVLPMSSIRLQLVNASIGQNVKTTTSARLKRMKSIRKKLRESDRTLYQIQDIAGCRAILGSIDDVSKIVRWYNSNRCIHEIQRNNDYIAEPKAGGYRSHHLVLKFNGERHGGKFSRHTVELQLRTHPQHIWATAVEAVGLVRNEDLKGGKGDGDWLRLFALMGHRIAIWEGAPGVAGLPHNDIEVRDELSYLEQKLSALKNLSAWNAAIHCLSNFQGGRGFYLITFDRERQETSVSRYKKFSHGEDALIGKERDFESGDSVLVELEKADDLRQAYPNYFMDVGVFASYLQAAVCGNSMPEESKQKEQIEEIPRMNYTIKAIMNWWQNRR
jgi:ppGpp synthetase/RelA/SpoT-type nucleotidyltranferase